MLTTFTHIRTCFLALALIAVSSVWRTPSLQAEPPEMIELTLMFVTDPILADLVPAPASDDAIGLVLDGNQGPTDDGLKVAFGFGNGFEGSYNPTDASYITKGGTFPVRVYVKDVILPKHGFINLKKSVIVDSDAAFATQSGSTLNAANSETATVYLMFAYGLFELHSR